MRANHRTCMELITLGSESPHSNLLSWWSDIKRHFTSQIVHIWGSGCHNSAIKDENWEFGSRKIHGEADCNQWGVWIEEAEGVRKRPQRTRLFHIINVAAWYRNWIWRSSKETEFLFIIGAKELRSNYQRLMVQYILTISQVLGVSAPHGKLPLRDTRHTRLEPWAISHVVSQSWTRAVHEPQPPRSLCR